MCHIIHAFPLQDKFYYLVQKQKHNAMNAVNKCVSG